MRVFLIRHGTTPGNLERRYIGCTNEPLAPEGLRELAALRGSGVLSGVGSVYCSPLLRCIQSAALLFPDMPFSLRSGLRECDFGRFEGRTAAELSADADYTRWVEAGCTGAIPEGEAVRAFRRRVCRCIEAICLRERALARADAAPVAIVFHGGGIMAALARYEPTGRGFYEYRLPNCGWMLCEAAWAGEELSLRLLESGGPHGRNAEPLPC